MDHNKLLNDMKKTYMEEYIKMDWNKSSNDEIRTFNERWKQMVMMQYGLGGLRIVDESPKSNETKEFLHGIYECLYQRCMRLINN